MSDLNKWHAKGSTGDLKYFGCNWTRTKGFNSTSELLTTPSELFLSEIHLQDLWNCFQFVLYQNPHRFDRSRCVYLTPSKVLAILYEPCSWKLKYFLLPWYNPVHMWGPLGCLLGFWPSGPKACGSNYETNCKLPAGEQFWNFSCQYSICWSQWQPVSCNFEPWCLGKATC